MAEIYAMEDEWNDPSVSFSSIRMNVDDIASSGTSKLLNLQVSGVTQFAVFKDGSLYPPVAYSGQGALADTALQPGDNIDELVNNIGYLLEVPAQWRFSANQFGNNLKTSDTTLQLALNRLNNLEVVGGGGGGDSYYNSTINNLGNTITINDSGTNTNDITYNLYSGGIANTSWYIYNSGTVVDSGVVYNSGNYYDNTTFINSGTYNDYTTLINNGTIVSGIRSVNGYFGPDPVLTHTDVGAAGSGDIIGMLVSGADISALTNNVPYLSGTQVTYGWDSSGFGTNLAPADNTLQEIFNKLDILPIGGGGGDVTSVNGQSGVVVLDYSHVGAEPLDITIIRIGSGVSLLNNDAGYITSAADRPRDMVLVCSDEDTEITFPPDPNPVLTFWNPNTFEVTGIKWSCNTAPTGVGFSFDIDVSGVNIGTYILGDGVQTGSQVQAQTIAENNKVEISLNSVGATFGGAGFKVYLLGHV